MSALDRLRSLAESEEPDHAVVPFGLTYRDARMLLAGIQSLTQERDEARRGGYTIPVESYVEPCGEHVETCSVCGDELGIGPHTWVECSRKLAAHRDHLLGYAATLEHERDAARRKMRLLMRLLERSRSSKADLRTLLAFARSERDKAEEELRALEWLTGPRLALGRSETGDKLIVRPLRPTDPTCFKTWAEAARSLGREDKP